MRRQILGVVAAALLPFTAAALDGAHGGVFSENCASCHVGHRSPGAALTSVAGNANLCFSCHNVAGKYFGVWNETTAQGVPGVSGHSHSWSGAANGLGATPPAPGTPMGDRLPGGNLQCSTCHDQHNYYVSAGGSQHVSAVTPSGGVNLDPPPPNAIPRGYLLNISTAGAPGVARFRISHDGSTWYGYNGSIWVANEPQGKLTGTNVTLDDTSVTVDFIAASYSLNAQYRFYIGQAFLRVPNTEGELCTTCHKDRHQSAANVEGTGPLVGTGGAIVLGTTYFSHPVGEALGNPYDRAANAILDADGATTQLTGDGNWTNNLNLSASGKVTCLSCHAPHNADSNSLTTDTR